MDVKYCDICNAKMGQGRASLQKEMKYGTAVVYTTFSFNRGGDVCKYCLKTIGKQLANEI